MKNKTIDIKIIELLSLNGGEFLTVSNNYRTNQMFYYVYVPQTSDYETLTPVIEGIEQALDKAIGILSTVKI